MTPAGARRALVVSVLICAACGPAARDPSAAGKGGKDELCSALGPLADLHASLGTDTELAAYSPLSQIVDADEELGYLAVVRERLQGLAGAAARALAPRLERLQTMLETRRAALAALLTRAKSSHADAETALDRAAVCKQVDLRDLSLPPNAVGKRIARQRAHEGAPDEADAKLRKANKAIASSKACESAVRLWASTETADLTSEVSLRSVAAHVFELDLDKERAAFREELARTLKELAEELRSLHAVDEPDKRRELATLRSDVNQRLEAAQHECVATMGASDRVVGSRPEPRRATVNVRPKWSGALQKLAGGQVQFGSGFLVRWRGPTGAVETRVVTNNHVMGGASEADIVSGEMVANEKPDAKDRHGAGAGTWSATLIHADPHDDVAILRLDKAAESIDAFRDGLTFRLNPAREQEPVTAAGFPGVGVRPSFQVSKGIVSNAKFGAEAPGSELLFAFVQHTAAIDPGNSGGPLLDGDGRLLGMNTLKIVGRENVGLAIPTLRIQLAMERADERSEFTVRHAEASCNTVLAALSAPAPVFEAMSRFGLRLFETSEDQQGSSEEASYRDAVRGAPPSPADAARLRAYGAARAKVEHEGGIAPFDTCSNVTATAPAAGAQPGPAAFRATFRTTEREHEMVFEEESGVVRLVELR